MVHISKTIGSTCDNYRTAFSDELSLFIHDRRAAEFLNAKKIDLLGKIRELSYRSNKKDYLVTLEEAVSALPDVDVERLYGQFMECGI